MDVDDHGGLPADADRHGEVAVNGHAVARLEGDGFHLGKLVLLQPRTVAEEHGGFALTAVVVVVINGRVIVGVGDEPGLVGEIAAGDAEVGVALLLASR
jgi:hypothetical protein